jgi:hypothetical protein
MKFRHSKNLGTIVSAASLCMGLSLSSLPAFAAAGGSDRGGGDLCEDRIKEISGDIRAWILKGGHQSLQMQGVSAGAYQSSMLDEISKASVRCVAAGDPGYPVQINGAAKVCVWDRSAANGIITCDMTKFRTLSESEQYVLIHHEYAGLADIERPNGADSNYQVSNQISGYLVNQVVKKLAVKNFAPGQWKTLEGADGKRVLSGLIDLLEKTRFSDCDVKTEILSPSTLTSVAVISKNKSTPHSFIFYNNNYEGGPDYNLNPGAHLLLQDGSPVMIRHWFDHTFDGGNGSANVLYTLDPSESKITKLEFAATQRDTGTFVHPITDGPELPWYSFTCTPTL